MAKSLPTLSLLFETFLRLRLRLRLEVMGDSLGGDFEAAQTPAGAWLLTAVFSQNYCENGEQKSRAHGFEILAFV